MGKVPIHRVDGNEDELLRAFGACGCRTHKIHAPLDYLVAIPTTQHGWLTLVVEFKDAKTKVRPKQQQFMDHWPGLTWLVRCPQDVYQLVSLLQGESRD